MLDSKVIHGFVVVDAGVAFTTVETPRKRRAELPDEIVIGDAKIAELEDKTDKMSKKVRCVNAAIDKDCAVDIGVGQCAKGCRLCG